MPTYTEQKQRVLMAQDARIAMSEVEHSSICQCNGCVAERAERTILENMPEHIQAKKEWHNFIQDLSACILKNKVDFLEDDDNDLSPDSIA